MRQPNESLMIQLGCMLKVGSYHLSIIESQIKLDYILFFVLNTQTKELHQVRYKLNKG